jgi:hypothetical protein
MSKQLPNNEFQAIETLLKGHPDGLSRADIAVALALKVSTRTLQSHLRYLVAQGRIEVSGQTHNVKYKIAQNLISPPEGSSVTFSDEALAIRQIILQPIATRKTVRYERAFLDASQPNETEYFTTVQRAHLHNIGAVPEVTQPAGTFARKILNRLLIDLSWNSSRLEGNTYTLLDTRRLLEFGKQAEGKDQLEAQMIINHKEAIEFLTSAADEISFNRYTLLNLHGLLAQNLLSNSSAEGRLRRIEVGIHGSTFLPLAVPQLIEECFEQILTTAQAINDPFEQSFFVMVHLPYLQPFEDVNKCVSRLAANIPFIVKNLIPLTFLDVEKDLYSQATLGVYELNRIELLRDVYICAYGRSAERYTDVQHTLGEPDPFRLKHREAIREVIGAIVRNQNTRKEAFSFLEIWSAANIHADEREPFREVGEEELQALHEGNFARYKIRPSEFEAWKRVWG